jgi:phosphopantetheine--protein transferase-like protein
VAVPLPAEEAPLRPEERAHADGLPAARRATWVGGRVALRAALDALGVAAGPLLATPRGAPALRAGVAGSISHKEALAVALAARAPGGETLGVDVELDPTVRAPRADIAPRVLTPAERARVDALAPAERTREVLVSFAAKEAIYKALDPWVRRSVSWQEVELSRGARGALAAVFHARPGEPDLSLEVHEEAAVDPSLILVTARATLRSRPPSP